MRKLSVAAVLSMLASLPAAAQVLEFAKTAGGSVWIEPTQVESVKPEATWVTIRAEGNASYFVSDSIGDVLTALASLGLVEVDDGTDVWHVNPAKVSAIEASSGSQNRIRQESAFYITLSNSSLSLAALADLFD